MAYTIQVTKRFKKNVELCRKRGCDMSRLRKVIQLLADTGTLPSQYRPHRLSGNHQGEWEAHIQPDWLIVWQQNDDSLVLILLTTGTHSGIFG